MSTSSDDVELEDTYVGLSEGRSIAYYITFIFFSLLSLFGSLSICYMTFRGKKANQLYHRLVLGLSIADIVFSCGLLAQPFLIPTGTGAFAIGNRQTCTFSGLLTLCIFSPLMYNVALGIYYLWTMRYRKSDHEISKMLEPYVHIMAFLVPIVLGIWPLLDGAFNLDPYVGVCLFYPYPQTCIDDKDPSDCLRGKHYLLIYNIIFALYLIMGIGLLLCICLFYWTIRQVGMAFHSEFDADGSIAAQQKQRLYAVRRQALCYFAAVVNTNVWMVMLFYIQDIFGRDDEDGIPYFLCMLGIASFWPLQGFFNWIIHVRPRVLHWKEARPEKSWFWAYQQVLTGAIAPTARHIATTYGSTVHNTKPSTTENSANCNHSTTCHNISRLNDRSTSVSTMSVTSSGRDSRRLLYQNWAAAQRNSGIFHILPSQESSEQFLPQPGEGRHDVTFENTTDNRDEDSSGAPISESGNESSSGAPFLESAKPNLQVKSVSQVQMMAIAEENSSCAGVI